MEQNNHILCFSPGRLGSLEIGKEIDDWVYLNAYVINKWGDILKLCVRLLKINRVGEEGAEKI